MKPRVAACCSAAWRRPFWIVSDSQGGELPACEVDVDVILSDALGRVPLDRDIRIEVRRARGAG